MLRRRRGAAPPRRNHARWLPRRGEPAYGLYPAQEGWLAVAALEPHSGRRWADELGLDELTHEALTDTFRARTAEDWEAWARERDLPLGAVRQRE